MLASFNKDWFKKHQKGLVWFTNTFVGRWFFALGAVGIPKKARIYEIATNSISFDWSARIENEQVFIDKRTMFFSRNRLKLRLLKAWQPVENMALLTRGICWDLWRIPSEEFFTYYQRPLVRFINTRIGKRFFGIADQKAEIGKLRPNHYAFRLNGKKALDFRTNKKFWLILRHRTRYLRVIPWVIAAFTMPSLQRIPEFMPLLTLATYTFYPDANVETTSVDGRFFTSNLGSWQLTHDAIASEGAGDSDASAQSLYALDDDTGTPLYQINRAMYLFDTSATPNDDVVVSATFSVFGAAGADDTLNQDIHLCSSSPASNTALVTGDFDQFGSTSFGSLDQGSWSTSAYNAITINATGLATITFTDVTKFGIRYSSDINNSRPGPSDSFSYITSYFADQAGTTNDPKLVVITDKYFYPDPDTESTSVDGSVWRTSTLENWGTIRGGAGTNADDTSAANNGFRFADAALDIWVNLRRFICLFDTSSIPNGDTITAATLSFVGNEKLDSGGLNTPNAAIVTSTPASDTSLAASDYANLGTTEQASRVTYANLVADDSTYTDFPLNATGLGNITKTGVTKFGIRNGQYDIDNVAPTSGTNGTHAWNIRSADQTGTSADPKLVVTHSGAVAGSSALSLLLMGVG